MAVVGSGPAGLSCAHELRRLGHDVVVFEARDVPGGLDTLGIAAYKISTEFALAEIEQIRRIGIDDRVRPSRHGRRGPGDARRRSTPCSSASGWAGPLPLGIEGEDLDGVWEALDFIFQTHTRPFDRMRRRAARPGDRRRQHGDRRGDRRQAARGRDGHDRLPPLRGADPRLRLRIRARQGRRRPLRVVRPADPRPRRGRRGHGASSSSGPSSKTRASRTGRVRTVPGSNFVLAADMVVKALGQEPLLDLLAALPDLKCERGRIVVDPATGATSVPGLFAGGDCLRNGGEVVDAVQDGKVAARGMPSHA